MSFCLSIWDASPSKLLNGFGWNFAHGGSLSHMLHLTVWWPLPQGSHQWSQKCGFLMLTCFLLAAIRPHFEFGSWEIFKKKLIKHILWLDWLKETSSTWILEPSSCFTKHWSVLTLSTLIQFGPLAKRRYRGYWKVQKRATKLVTLLKKLPYKERLLQLNLHTLKYRRLRGDMIQVYKIIHDMYDRSVALELPRNV